MTYPHTRLVLVLAGNWSQFIAYMNQHESKPDQQWVFVTGERSVAGRQKENVELIKTGEWYKNTEGIEAIKRFYPGFGELL